MLEPEGDAPRTPRPGSVCLECGAHLEGPYCSWCGLKTGLAARPVDSVLQDLLNDLVLFDLKVWRTARDLFRAPAEVARHFLEGRRQKYLGPGRTIFFSTVVLAVATGGFTVGLGLAETVFGIGRAIVRGPGLAEAPPAWLPWVYVTVAVPIFSLATAVVMRGRLFVEHLVYGLYLWSMIWLFMAAESTIFWAYRWLLGEPGSAVASLLTAAFAGAVLVYGVRSFRDFYGLGSTLAALLSLPFILALAIPIGWGAAGWVVLVGALLLSVAGAAAGTGGPVLIAVLLYLAVLWMLRSQRSGLSESE